MRLALAACLALACSLSGAQDIPWAAAAFKRDFIRVNRAVWGPANPAFPAAQLEAESGFRPDAVSWAGARGLAQFIPATAEAMDRDYPGLSSLARYSPLWSLWANALLDRDLYRRYLPDRTRCDGVQFALSAYNGGPTRLDREIALCGADWPTCDGRQWSENVETQRDRSAAAWQENRTYVAKVVRREPAYASAGWGVRWCP
jgi:soluble lytic murein transglycosylase-like protein